MAKVKIWIEGSIESYVMFRKLERLRRLTEILGLTMHTVELAEPPGTTDHPHPVFLLGAAGERHLLDELEANLQSLVRDGLITVWHDLKLQGGDPRDLVRNRFFESAHLILLLMSPGFYNCDTAYNLGLRALDRNRAGQVLVVPVIEQTVDWLSGPFGALQPLPKSAKPVAKWENKADAYLEISQGIRDALSFWEEGDPRKALN